jgi:hypothetical protein
MSDQESAGPATSRPTPGRAGTTRAASRRAACLLVEITDRLGLLVREHYGPGPFRARPTSSTT